MCYYSKTMRADEFRDAKREGEDMRIVSDGQGHHLVEATSDNKIVCLLPGTQLHIENFQLNPSTMRIVIEDARYNGVDLNAMIGKQISTKFDEMSRGGYSADCIVLRNDLGTNTYKMHIVHLNVGMTFYTGAKRPDVANKVGVNDPSIMLDHKPTEEAPGLARTIGRTLGVCS